MVRYHTAMLEPTTGAVIASGIAAALIGYIWYHPKVFGAAWARMSGLTPEMQAAARNRMPLMAFVGLLAATFVAYVMSYVSAAWGFYDWQGALQLGFWCWAGFVAPIMLGSVLWEQKPFSLYLINALYWLLAFLVMAQFIVFAYSLEYTMYYYEGYDEGVEYDAYVAE
jgi:hypothetical protein